MDKEVLERLNFEDTGFVKDKNGTSSETSEPSSEERGTWANKVEFFLAIMGYTVGIGSVWRFPMAFSRNGGGAFLIPFFLFLIVIGGPLYYMEVCLGQFSGLSAGLSFEFCPLFKGIGILQVLSSAIVLWYCGMILTWSYYFFYCSFFPQLPWSHCGQEWNTDRCRDSFQLMAGGNETSLFYNATNGTSVFANTTEVLANGGSFQSSALEFWEYKVIGRSTGLDDPGQVQGHLVICMLIAWVTVVLAVINGVKTLGKVVYVTATVPYVMLTVVLIKGITLDGSMEGILFYVTPDFTKLGEAQVWIDAAIQVFYSLGPGWGGVITMASYNKFHQKSFWSSTMCVVTSGFTSFYNGLVVFSVIGFMAAETNMDVEVLARQSGPGLVFVAFPTAISKLPLPQIWSVLFFLAFITVAYDSVFGMFETVTSCLIDMFPRQLVRRRVLVNIAAGIMFFVTGLPLTLNSGIFILQLCEWYFGRFGLLFAAVLECVTICWIYGTERFSQDIELMTGRRVSAPLRVLWAFVAPILALVVFVIVCAQHSPPDYGDGYVYSPLSRVIGMAIGLMPIVAMVISGLWTLKNMTGNFQQRLRQSLRPGPKWKPNDPEASATYKLKYMYQTDTDGLYDKMRDNIRTRRRQ